MSETSDCFSINMRIKFLSGTVDVRKSPQLANIFGLLFFYLYRLMANVNYKRKL